jgi:hypothetical protein
MNPIIYTSGQNSKSFYPTPATLAAKMLSGIDFRTLPTILEPSAGKGDLWQACVSKWNIENTIYSYTAPPPDIDCIEIDENLRYILKGKGARVVGGDFLKFKTHKQYDLIVMNPPFDQGDKHLLKALELVSNGGAVVCLLNAETLRNPYTATRDKLSRLLAQYDASIEHIPDAFKDAERKADVDVALIKVAIPEVERDSIIIDELRKAPKPVDDPDHIGESTQMVVGDFVQGICDTFDFETRASIALIREWKAMKRILGGTVKPGQDSSGESYALQLTMNNEHEYKDSLTINGFIRAVRGKYWEALFENPKFMDKMTSNLREDLRKRIAELADYDFSVFNILSLQQEMNGKLIKGIEDNIMSTFDQFTHEWHYSDGSKNRHYFDGWVTNQCWKVGKRVIMPRMNAWDYGYLTFIYEIEQTLADIEKSLDYLDGSLTGAEGIRDILNRAKKSNQSAGVSFKYFTVTFYKKGTAHITFTNQNVLDKLNLFAARHKGWLPPAYGRKRYKDMNADERRVVDSFEGEAHYNMIMDRAEYYLSDPAPLMLGEGA